MPSHRVDEFGHRLIDSGDERLEARINRKATRYERLRDDPGRESEALSLRAELATLAFGYFRVVGQGMGDARLDDVIVDTFLECLEKYKSDSGPFTRYVRFVYARRRIDFGRVEDRAQDYVQYDEGGRAGSGEDEVADEGGMADDYACESPTGGDVFEDGRWDVSEDEVREQEALRRSQANAAVVEVVSLVMGFLDHVVNQDHSFRAKTYLKLNFTEWTTYWVKSEPLFAYCEPFENDETRVFSTIEGGFLSVFMSEECGTIRKLWETDLREGYGEIIPFDDERLLRKNAPAPWKLPTKVHLDYLKDAYGIVVSSGTISHHRKKFKKLWTLK